MKALAIAGVNVRRMLRERSNIFFVFVFPIAIIVLIGIEFGSGFDPAIGLYAADTDQISVAVIEALENDESIALQQFDTESDMVRAVERGGAQAGVSLPAKMFESASDGQSIEIGYLARPGGFGAQLRAVVQSTIAEAMAPVGAGQFAAEETSQSFQIAYATAVGLASQAEGPEVDVSAVGEAIFPDTLGQFDLGAAQQLVLFVFLTALAGSAALILTRQLGISQRMLSTPTSVRAVITGESLGRFGVALVQGFYIIGLTLVIFGVNWGNWVGAALILVALSAVGAGAGMLMGAVFNNDQQAGGVGVMVSLGLAALGGCMLPVELFSPTMQRIAHLTPHAWALGGYAELVRRGGGPFDILPELGVLIFYAAVLLSLAGWRLRVAITRP
jgi:ABC-2 type transport system permease protein